MCAALSLQSCPILGNPVDCSLPGSSIHRILQARTLDRFAMLSSRGSFWPRDQTCISFLNWQTVLYHWRHLESPLVPPAKPIASVETSSTSRVSKSETRRENEKQDTRIQRKVRIGGQHRSKVKALKLNPSQLCYTFSCGWKNVQGVKL